jgi:hypothetical protein
MESKIIQTEIEFIDEVVDDSEAFASISLNPVNNWAKFILTDDKPNANKQRIPIEEFDNLVNTGVFMPIKMAAGEISEGHAGTFPIGTISHLQKVGNQIKGIAALWKRERPEDVDLIKEMYAKKVPVQLSWEIFYTDSSIVEDVEELRGTTLRGVTIVKNPAYEGRTAITAVASKDKNLEEENKMELEEQVEKLQKDVQTATEALSTKDAELETLNTELTSLREFKAQIDREKEEADKLIRIKEKFSAAKLEKSEEYFVERKEKLLGLSDEELDFMIQEIVSGLSTEASSRNKDLGIPPLDGSAGEVINAKTMAEYLKKSAKR